jgi:hypothetical protein
LGPGGRSPSAGPFSAARRYSERRFDISARLGRSESRQAFPRGLHDVPAQPSESSDRSHCDDSICI